MNAIQGFKTAMLAAGLDAPEFIYGDGKLRRFDTGEKKGKTGWYLLHLDGVPAGSFGDWRTMPEGQTWCSKERDSMTESERQAHKARIAAMQVQREVEEKKRHAKAATDCEKQWDLAKPCPAGGHPYLLAKGVKPYGVRLDGLGCLMVPAYIDAKLTSLQFIDEDGGKRFKTGGRVRGASFTLGELDGATRLIVCEGFATGASIFEVAGAGALVVVAFNAGNLLPVAKALRAKHSDAEIIIAADDDVGKPGNPGLSKATEAAKAIKAKLAVPVFANREDGQTDFNDLHQSDGLEAVMACINAVKPVEAATQSNPATTPGELFPGIEARPRFTVLDDLATDSDGRSYAPGVYYCTVSGGKKDEQAIVNRWVCSPLHIDAITSDSEGNNFGRLLRFKPTVGSVREWAMPMDLLAGDGVQLRAELLNMGVEIGASLKDRQQFAEYLQRVHPVRQVRCAVQVGWCADSFVLPDIVIGPKADGVIYQSGERYHDENTVAGTLNGWQRGVSWKAPGNPLLLLSISASFAGPLMQRCKAESGGFHLVGNSSTGKTTLIEAACSVWGGPAFKRSWRATANGIEGAAALFNDCLLALDEISECDPREVGAIVYALGNGVGKQRASRTGRARSVTRWRCFVVSSGERTIETAMREGNYRAKAGQSMRLLDIPVQQEHGAWDELHGAEDGAAFSDCIKREAGIHYGVAGRAFLERLTRDEQDFGALLAKTKEHSGFAASEGQHQRVASRFALLAMAGELATAYDITGWQPGDATEAATIGFSLWKAERGEGNSEKRQVLCLVSEFLERHGDSRFTDSENQSGPVKDRAGWWRTDSLTDKRTYLFTGDGLRASLPGIDFKRGLNVLENAGALPGKNASGKYAQSMRIFGRVMKLYAIDPEKLEPDS